MPRRRIISGGSIVLTTLDGGRWRPSVGDPSRPAPLGLPTTLVRVMESLSNWSGPRWLRITYLRRTAGLSAVQTPAPRLMRSCVPGVLSGEFADVVELSAR